MVKRQYIEVFSSKGLRENAPTTLFENEHLTKAHEVTFREFVGSKAPGNRTYGSTDDTPLTGAVMNLTNFHYLNTPAYFLLCHTVSNTYEYNASSKLFECITKGEVIHDCESVWDELSDGDVTATRDNTSGYVRKGTYSSKMVVDGDCDAGDILGTDSISSLDISGSTHVHFYIYSSTALTDGDLQLLLDETASCGGSPSSEELDIPDIAANVWTEVTIEFAGTTASRDAIISVGLKMIVDKGAFNVWVDDIRAITPGGGGTSSPINTLSFPDSSGNFLHIVNRSADGLQKWDGSSDTMEALAGWTSYKAKDIFELGARLIGIHTYEGAAWQPVRVRWTKTGDPEDTTDTSAGFTDIITEAQSGKLIRGAKLGEVGIIYGSKSIVVMRYTGEATDAFAFEMTIPNVEFIASGGLLVLEDMHVIFLRSGLYSYRGGNTLDPIDDGIREALLRDINWSYADRCFFEYDNVNKEFLFHYPSSTSTSPDKYYRYNLVYKNWSKGTRSYTTSGVWKEAAFTIADMTEAISTYTQPIYTLTAGENVLILMGDVDGKIWQENSGWDYKGSAIDGWLESKDFVVSKYVMQGACWMESNFEVKGSGTLEVSYSVDFGNTWSTPEAITLTTGWASPRIDFEETAKQCRLRFRNSASGEYFYIRFFNLGFLKLTGRGWT